MKTSKRVLQRVSYDKCILRIGVILIFKIVYTIILS